MNSLSQATAFFYTLVDSFCFVIIAILLYTALLDVDRNRLRWHQLNLMIMQLSFCIIEILWILVFENVIPRTVTSRVVTNVFLYCSVNSCSFSMFLLLNAYLEKIARSAVFSRRIPFIVFWIMMIAIISTPWTKLVFDIDEDGVLLWGPLYIPFMIILIGDLILSSIRGLILAFRSDNETDRNLCIVIALYAIPVFLGGYIHVRHYEMPSVAMGLTISIVLFYVMQIKEQISIDSLTGTNNRKQGERFFLRHIRNINTQQAASSESGLYLFMIDVNKFKAINDTYGHAEGDKALIVTAEALRDACTFYADKCMLCRFGGDEFVIGGMFESNDLAQLFSEMIKDCVEKKCIQKELTYSLSVSVGFERYVPEYKTLKALLAAADKKMYEQKKLAHSVK